jgi:DNA-binding GntR family transcriptional regulator
MRCLSASAQGILDALTARDSDAAHDLMSEHAKGIAHSIRGLFKSLEAKAGTAGKRALGPEAGAPRPDR